MKKSQLESLIREVIQETIRKVDGKYVVYPEKGGKRLGTHSTRSAAEKQLTAIHLNKEAIVKDEVHCDGCGWKWKVEDGGDRPYSCHKCGHDNTPTEDKVYKTVQAKVKPPVDWEKRDWELYDENYANSEDLFKFLITDQVYDEEDDSLLAVEYKFNTPEDTYRVEFYSGEYNPDDKIFDLAFGLDREGLYKLNTFQMTGKGQVKKILKTLTAIIQDFLTKFDVEKVNIFPTDEKRRRIFKAIIGSIAKVEIHENYADGKVKGKSRPGRAKKAGAVVRCRRGEI